MTPRCQQRLHTILSPASRAVIARMLRGVVLSSVLLLTCGNLSAAVTETKHDAWTLRCEETAPEEPRQCIILQNLVLVGGGEPVLQFSIGLAPSGRTPTALISLPLGISLPPGVSVRIDAGKSATFPVERCEPDGCQAGMHLRAATVEQLKNGTELEITFYDGERQPIVAPLPLAGFAAAYAALGGETPPPSSD